MKPFPLFFSLIVPVLFAGCGPRQAGEQHPAGLSISDGVYTDQVNSSAVFTSVQCVPLETGDDLLIDEIVKVIHRDGFFHVADRTALYRFDENGKLQGKIKRDGPGPEEYDGIADFEIETQQSTWILSRKTLYKYTWDGVLERKISLDYRVMKIHLLGPGKICAYSGNQIEEHNRYRFNTIDLNTGRTIAGHLEIDPQKSRYLHVFSSRNFSSVAGHAGQAYLFTTFDDTVYKWSADSVAPAFTVDINRRNIPPSFYGQDYSDVSVFFQSLFKNNYAYGTDMFVEYAEDFLYAYLYSGERHFALISKQTGEATTDFKRIDEDVLLSGYPVNLLEQHCFLQPNNELVLPLVPADVAEYARRLPDEESRRKVLEHIRYTDDDQNPVLLILNR
jgi:hypothetical protein